MKKLLSGILACVLAVSVFSGCTPTNSVNDKDEQGRTMLSVGNWPSKDGAYKDTITRQKAEFEADNTDMVIIPDNWAFDIQTFYSKAASNQLPNLYYGNFTEIEKVESGEYYTDIKEGLKRAGYEGKINPAIMQLIEKDGKIVSFPTAAYSLGLAYNVDLFQKAGLMNADGTPMQPKNWDEVAEFAKKITEATGKPGFVIPTMGNCGGWLFTPIAWSYGVEFMKNEGGGKYTATFDNEKMVAALQFISDLKWKHNVFGDNSLIDLNEYYKQFAIENIGMILAAGNYTDSVYQYEMPIEHIGIMAMPAGPEKHVTLTGGGIATVANGATEDQVDVAIKWLEKTGKGKEIVLDEDAENGYKQKVSEGRAIGIRGLQVFTDDCQVVSWQNEMLDKYCNIDINHVKLYNDSLTDTSIELRPEEPVCAQELYQVLDGVIQEILTNQNADIKALVSKANRDFQSNFLDTMN